MSYPADLAAYRAVGEDSDLLGDEVADRVSGEATPVVCPFVFFLPFVEEAEAVGVREEVAENPFGNLRSVNTVTGSNGDIRVFVYRTVCDVIDTRAENGDYLKFWSDFRGRKVLHRHKDGNIFEVFIWNMTTAFHVNLNWLEVYAEVVNCNAWVFLSDTRNPLCGFVPSSRNENIVRRREFSS